jgi:hypothetical protein
MSVRARNASANPCSFEDLFGGARPCFHRTIPVFSEAGLVLYDSARDDMGREVEAGVTVSWRLDDRPFITARSA